MKKPLVSKKYLFTFILITSLFALWGFANDITNPMVAAFQTVMELSAAKASLIQFAFYGGYATMAIPAALFIRRYSYKSGILLGLALYAIGAFLFIPAAEWQEFSFFCVSLYIAQAFNPVGSLSGMAVASFIVLPQLLSDQRDAAGKIIFPLLSDAEKASIRLHDLAVIRNPYVAIGLVVVAVLVIIALTKMPKTESEEKKAAGETHTVKETLSNLWYNSIYREGVFAQVCYVAAQIMVWTFIIQYADHLGINKATAQMYNIVAMSLNLSGRFIGTFIMHYVNTRRLLMLFGIGASVCTLGAICIEGLWGLYSLVAISLFMSIMFPTIYGIALENVDSKDTHLGAAFLVMAIVGGALMPPLQGMMIDQGTIWGMPAVNMSFILPLVCFLVIIVYGYRSFMQLKSIK